MQHDFTFIVFISLIRLLLFCFFTFVGFLICLTVLSLDVMIWSFRCLKWKNCLIVENAGIYIAKLAVSRTPHNDIVIHYILWSLLFFFLYEVLFKMMSNLYSMEKEINSREFRFSVYYIQSSYIYEILDQLLITLHWHDCIVIISGSWHLQHSNCISYILCHVHNTYNTSQCNNV